MPLSHISKLYAVVDGEISKLIADPATAPSAPSAATANAALTGAGASGGSTTVSYTAIATNGVDATASALATSATCNAAAPSAAFPLIVTITAPSPVPSNQRVLINRTVGGLSQGIVGSIEPGSLTFTDTGLTTGYPYVANTSGVLYGPKIKIPGMKTVAVTPAIKEVTLKGDFAVLDTDAYPEGMKIAVNYAKINFDAKAVMLGSTTTDTGVTPNQVSTFSMGSTNKFQFFKLEAASATADTPGGDAHLVFWKCKVAAYKYGLADADYETFEFTANSVPRIADKRWIDIVLNETAVAVN